MKKSEVKELETVISQKIDLEIAGALAKQNTLSEQMVKVESRRKSKLTYFVPT